MVSFLNFYFESILSTDSNQSVGSACAAFVKEPVDNLKKKKLNKMIFEDQVWANKPTDEQGQGRTDFGMNTAR